MEIWRKLMGDIFSDFVGIASFSVIAITLIIVSVILGMFVFKSTKNPS